MPPAPASQRGKPLQAWIRALESVAAMQREPTLTLPALLERVATEHGQRAALLGPGGTLTYAQLARQADRVARWAAREHPGATIGLLMPNRTDYVAIWLGLTRAGCVVALLNHHVVGDALQHAVHAAACRLVIAPPDFADRIVAVPVIDPDQLDAPADQPLPPMPDRASTALLVYTSGTTSLPKAARLTHARILEWALWFAGMMDISPADRLYDCLPLYHSTGGIVAIGASLARGASVLIAPGFSASRFWDDVVDGECTLAFYIGELCRYLLASPPHPRERAHQLRLVCGNGLQQSVWEPLKFRFGIPHVLEFYAATEGSVSLYNCEERPGAIGRIPPFLQSRFPMTLIRIDPTTMNPIRNDRLLCIPCTPDEPGEALGRLDPSRSFDGYTDAQATSEKLLHDVLEPGDRWFRTGDLMRRDPAGFLYFIDRIGDTFRWKGENVSTSEVAAQLRAAPGILDAIVFGVKIPGQEGRAGMAAIVPAPDFDPAELWAHLDAALPTYAQPVFLRLCAKLDLTGTLKLSATQFARDGYADSPDPILAADRVSAIFIPCDPDLIYAIERGDRRV